MKIVQLVRLLPLAAAAFASVATSSMVEPVPEPNTCQASPGAVAVVDTLELTHVVDSNELGPIVATYADGDAAVVRYDYDQPVLVVGLTLTGDAVLECLPQTTVVSSDGSELAREERPLLTYTYDNNNADGERHTGDLELPLGSVPATGEPIDVTVVVGDVTTTVHLIAP